MLHKESQSTSEKIARQGVHLSIEALRTINPILEYSPEQLYLPIEDEKLVNAFKWFSNPQLDTDSSEYLDALELTNILSTPEIPIMLVLINTNAGKGPLQPLLLPHIGQLLRLERNHLLTAYDPKLTIEFPVLPGEIRSRAMNNCPNNYPDTISNSIAFFSDSLSIKQGKLWGNRLFKIQQKIRSVGHPTKKLLMEQLIPIYEEIYSIASLQDL